MMRRTIFALPLAWITLGWTGAALGQTNDCGDLANQGEMNACFEREYREADAELNKTYEALRDRVSSTGRETLRDAQRAWIAYRDAQCAFESAGTEGGSIHPTIVAICRTELTRTQTRRLRRQLDCEEGDLSCGGQ